MITIGVIGEGNTATLWRSKLAVTDGVNVIGLHTQTERPAGNAMRRLTTEETSLVDSKLARGIVLAGSSIDVYAAAKRALVQNKHVFCAGPFTLGLSQARTLAELARRQRRILAFRDDIVHTSGFAMLKRMAGGRNPIWLPLYIRAHAGEIPSRRASRALDAVAAREIAAITELLQSPVATVAAVGCCGEGTHDLEGAFLTIIFRNGVSAHLSVSLTEAVAERRLVVAAEGRTLTLLSSTEGSNLHVAVSQTAANGAPDHRFCTVMEHPEDMSDPIAAQAHSFTEAIAHRDVTSANCLKWLNVASLWDAAHRSMSMGGAPTAVTTEQFEGKEQPRLQLIEGRGLETGHTQQARPALALV